MNKLDVHSKYFQHKYTVHIHYTLVDIKKTLKKTYNLNFSFHFGLNVWGLIDVARINFAGTGPPPRESRCSRRPPSFRLKLSRKLWCFRNLSWCGESKLLSKPTSDNVRGVNGGCGEIGAPAGWIPSIQYGSLYPGTNQRYKIFNLKMFLLMN